MNELSSPVGDTTRGDARSRRLRPGGTSWRLLDPVPASVATRGRRCRRSRRRPESSSRRSTARSAARPGCSRPSSRRPSPVGSARADVPVEERPAIRAVIEERILADRSSYTPRPSPGSIAGRAASPGPARCGRRRPGARRVWDEIEAGRLAGQGRFAGMLAERGVLRAGRLRRAGARRHLDTLLAGGP